MRLTGRPCFNHSNPQELRCWLPRRAEWLMQKFWNEPPQVLLLLALDFRAMGKLMKPPPTLLLCKMGEGLMQVSMGCCNPHLHLKFAEHLQCARQGSRCQGYSRKQNRHTCHSLQVSILEKEARYWKKSIGNDVYAVLRLRGAWNRWLHGTPVEAGRSLSMPPV